MRWLEREPRLGWRLNQAGIAEAVDSTLGFSAPSEYGTTQLIWLLLSMSSGAEIPLKVTRVSLTTLGYRPALSGSAVTGGLLKFFPAYGDELAGEIGPQGCSMRTESSSGSGGLRARWTRTLPRTKVRTLGILNENIQLVVAGQHVGDYFAIERYDGLLRSCCGDPGGGTYDDEVGGLARRGGLAAR